MVWGTQGARRSEDRWMTREPVACEEDRIPQSAECNCGATAILAAGRLPRDWRIRDGEARCGDCLAGTNIVVDLAAMRQVLRRKPAQPIGNVETRRPHHGCRVSDEVVCGFAALEFRAGTAPPVGRDEAVSFLLDPSAIDELIIHLSAVRAELIASQHFGTDAFDAAAPQAPRGH